MENVKRWNAQKIVTVKVGTAVKKVNARRKSPSRLLIIARLGQIITETAYAIFAEKGIGKNK